jgi:hypothetical protein
VTVFIFKIIKSYTYSKHCRGVRFWLHVYIEISKIIHVNRQIASSQYYNDNSQNSKHALENKLTGCLQSWIHAHVQGELDGGGGGGGSMVLAGKERYRGSVDGEHEFRRVSTDSGTDGDGVDEQGV